MSEKEKPRKRDTIPPTDNSSPAQASEKNRPMLRDMTMWAIPPGQRTGDSFPVRGIRLRSRDIREMAERDLQDADAVERIKKKTEEREEAGIRNERRKLFRVRTQIELKKAEETLASYEKAPQVAQVEGLESVVALIAGEVFVTRATNLLDRLMAHQLALDEIRKAVIGSLKKGARYRISLKPGYDEIVQKELARLQPLPPSIEVRGIFLKLDTIGYIVKEEIKGA